MKIEKVKQINGSVSLPVIKREDLSSIVEEPLLKVCENLFDKNIRTFYSSCNSEGKKTELFHAIVGIDARSLSQENLSVLHGLMKQYPRNIYESFWYGQSFKKERNPFIMMDFCFHGNTNTDEVGKFFENLTSSFCHQKKINNNKIFKKYDFLLEGQNILLVPTEENYKKFLDSITFDWKTAAKLNSPYLSSMNLFYEEQKRKFEPSFSAKSDEDKIGCCFNFAAYLIKEPSGLLMTTTEPPTLETPKGAIHCCVCHLNKEGDVVVTDPAWDKQEGGSKHFAQPLESYLYKGDKNRKLGYYVFTDNNIMDQKAPVVDVILGRGFTRIKLSDDNRKLKDQVEEIKKVLILGNASKPKQD